MQRMSPYYYIGIIFIWGLLYQKTILICSFPITGSSVQGTPLGRTPALSPQVESKIADNIKGCAQQGMDVGRLQSMGRTVMV